MVSKQYNNSDCRYESNSDSRYCFSACIYTGELETEVGQQTDDSFTIPKTYDSSVGCRNQQ